jgi:transposase-like protein/predicted RNA-binding Zn-ribbon protein involved in translation (DUF1610 family)
MFEHFEGRSMIKFSERFDSEEKCKEYIARLKWGNGFVCPKCGHTHAWEGVKPYTKVCKDCRHIESVTANSLFHKLKFGLRKAFLILFEMGSGTKSCSSTVMAARYDINQKTAWLFMSKARKAMESSCKNAMNGNLEVDECFIGGHREGKTGRGAADKKQVAISIEKAGEYGIKRAYAIKIENCSAKELEKLFDKHIHTDSIVTTDKWKGYLPLADRYQINQEVSRPKENFILIHRFIQGLKSWLRGVHHHVSDNYLQGYLNEYCFRFNRNRTKDKIFHLLVERMVSGNPVNYKLLYNT